MSRAADYTIQGFLYQFNKTILELLSASDESQITVEGIIEDIDVTTPFGTRAIQCKYHEAKKNFNLSCVYKPLLQMMEHFRKNESLDVEYRLYAYFPNSEIGKREVTVEELKKVTESKNKNYRKSFRDVFEQGIDLPKFLARFSFEFGKPFEELVNDVHQALIDSDLPKDSIETLMYPNALQLIADLSIKHNESDRKITKPKFLKCLRDVRKTAITRWTLALKTAKKILEARKKQLKPNLSKNSRLRYFLISESALEDFDTGIVTFIAEYLDKYHFKPAHNQAPLFCLDCTPEKFDDIRVRVHQKGIRFRDGFRGPRFFEDFFFREPIYKSKRRGEDEREFHIRLLRFNPDEIIFNKRKCDDLFIASRESYEGIDLQDVNVERLAATKLQEFKFVLGVSDVYE